MTESKTKHQLIPMSTMKTTVKWDSIAHNPTMYVESYNQTFHIRIHNLVTDDSGDSIPLIVYHLQLRIFLAERLCHTMLKVIRCLTFHWKHWIKGALIDFGKSEYILTSFTLFRTIT